MFNLNPREKEIIFVSHIKYISIVYKVLPLALIGFLHGTTKIIEIEKYELIYMILYIIISNINRGLLFNKEKEYEGFKLLNIALFICFLISLFFPIKLIYKILLLYSFVNLNIHFMSYYTSMYQPTRNAKFDILYVPFYSIGVFLGVCLKSPFNNMVCNYFFYTMLVDLLWVIVVYYCILEHKMFKKIFIQKTNLLTEIKSIKIATQRAFGDILFELLITLGKLIMVSSNKNANAFMLSAYLIISKTPLFSVAKEMLNQFKRTIIHKENNTNIKKVQKIMFILITFETIIISLIFIIISNGFDLEPLYKNWLPLCVLFSITYATLFAEIKSDYLMMLLQNEMILKDIYIIKFISSIFICIYRSKIAKLEFIYLIDFVMFTISYLIYKKRLKCIDIQPY